MYTRRAWLHAALAGGTAMVVSPRLIAAQTKPVITVYKSPTCGCCEDWCKHMSANGFTVRSIDVDDTSAIKAKFGVPDALLSCHTGSVGGYAVEGHVPADLIHKLLREKPAVAGIAVPGMPMGAPGMDQQAGRRDRYTVFLFERNGRTREYARR